MMWLSMNGLLQRVGVARVSLLVVRGGTLLSAVLLLRLCFVLAAILVNERTGSTRMRASWVHSSLSERICHILLAGVPRLVDESGAGLFGCDVATTASWVVAGWGWQAAEPTSVELFGIRSFLVATGEALGLCACLNLRAIETLGLEHHDLVIALIVRILSVVRNAALRHDLARSVRSMQVIRGSPLLSISGARRIAHRRLALGEATRDSARAKVTPIRQVLEAHLSLLWHEATASAHIKRRAAHLVSISIDRRWVRANSQRCVFLIVGVSAHVAKVLLSWVRVRIDDRVLVEHLPIGLVLRQMLEVSDLVLDLRLNAAETL